MIVNALCILLLAFEESYQWLHGNRMQGSAWTDDGDGHPRLRSRREMHQRNTRYVRLLQTVLIAVVWGGAGATQGGRVVAYPYGQLATLLLLLQFIRLLGRSMLDRWPVWTTMSAIQCGLLAILVLSPFPGTPVSTGSVAEGSSWLGGLLAVLTAAGLGVIFCLCVSYLLRKTLPSGSHFYEELPPMAASQELIDRFALVTLPLGVLSPVLMLFELQSSAGPLAPILPFALVGLALVLTTFGIGGHRKGAHLAFGSDLLLALCFPLQVASLGWATAILGSS